MSRPSAPRSTVNAKFPNTREEAEKAAADIKQHCWMQGCTCEQLKIEFVAPPLELPYVHVEHERTCLMTRMS